MATHELGPNPPFRSLMRASGLAEVWTHTHEKLKFNQFGWRCTNKESSYGNNTLVGNWNEHRFDKSEAVKLKPLPSQFGHYFETTVGSSYSGPHTQSAGLNSVGARVELKSRAGKEPTAFPGHQPELDNKMDREHYKSFITTSRSSFCNPNIRRTPQDVPIIS